MLCSIRVARRIGMELPLEDVRIVDLTHVWFGPFSTKILADLGAEVIKVEPPWGEMTRFNPPLVKGVPPTFTYMNNNKKGITLNLKSEKGLDIFTRLVKVSDIVINNFMPGTMEKLGIGYDTLKKVNPRIIYASLSGFGQYGPYSQRPSFAPIAEAMSGFTRLTGDMVDPNGPPLPTAEGYGDLGPAKWGVISILAALRFRDKTGRGQAIDVAQTDCMVAVIPEIVSYTMTGEMPWQLHKKHPWGIGGIIKAMDGYIYVAATFGGQTDRMAKMMGVEQVKGQEAFNEWVAQRTVDEAVKKLIEADIPVAPILSIDKTLQDPHVLARGMVAEVDHPQAGRIRMPNFPVKFSESPAKYRRPAPTLGQHNEEVLTGLLGFTKEEVAKLKAERAI